MPLRKNPKSGQNSYQNPFLNEPAPYIVRIDSEVCYLDLPVFVLQAALRAAHGFS